MIHQSTAIVEWVRDGPTDSDGTVGWFLGMVLWWRTWAYMAVLSLPLVAGVVVLSLANGFSAVLVTFVVATQTSEKLDGILADDD